MYAYVYYADIQDSLMFMYLHNHGLLQQSSYREAYSDLSIHEYRVKRHLRIYATLLYIIYACIHHV